MRTPAPLMTAMAVASFLCAACSASSSSPAPNDAGGLEPDADAAVDGASTDGSLDGANDTCNHPATTTYACSPMPPNEGACEGGPPQAGDAGPAVSYPLGCVATLPSCNPLYGGEAMTCSCTPLGMTAMWVCPF
jgi:hypothetical protein